MKILVAGGAGFIGSHLCERLLENGHDVVALDNCYTGSIYNLEKCYEMTLNEPSRFDLIRADVIDIHPLWYGQLDFIYHLASPASPKWYQKDPIKTIQSNVIGSFKLLELAKNAKCPIFFASTSEIYGDPLVHPQVESYWGNVNTVGPRSNYDESKRCAETIFYEYNRQYSLDVKIARIFNTYGPNMALDDGRVVSNFIVNALQGKDLVINGNGSQTRSFTYVSDLVDGIIKLSESSENTPVNLGNPVEFTIIELAELILKKTNSKSKITFSEPVKDEPYIRRPDVTKAESILGWKPSISLSEGLDLCIPYFKKEILASQKRDVDLILKLEQCGQKCSFDCKL